MDARPIGIFDSGLGGLTVVKEIRKVLPSERFVYFGDTARVPYGTKSKDTIIRFSKENVRLLLKFNVKLIVVACNTASSLSLPALSRSYRIPIIGVIGPGVDKAILLTKKGPIGIIGTRSTISSGVYQRLLKRRMPKVRVLSKPCPLFVSLVEEGWINNEITRAVIREYLEDFKKKGVETLILGCTHYPLLKRLIGEYMGKGVNLIDSARETAYFAKAVLRDKGLLANRRHFKEDRFLVSDEPSAFKKIGSRFLGAKIRFIKKIYT